MLRLQSAALVFASAASALPQADIPCALNGHLSTAGVCICRRAWKGQNCSELVLQPATVAFKLEDMVAWGVAVQQDTVRLQRLFCPYVNRTGFKPYG